MKPLKMVRSDTTGRVVLGFVGLSLVILGGHALLEGDLFHRSQWRGIVFAPLSVALGLILVYLVVFRWRTLAERPARRSRAASQRKIRG